MATLLSVLFVFGSFCSALPAKFAAESFYSDDTVLLQTRSRVSSAAPDFLEAAAREALEGGIEHPTLIERAPFSRHRAARSPHRPALLAGAFVPDESHCDNADGEKTIFVNSDYPKAQWTILKLNGRLLPDCPASCRISTDSSALESADAVVWNPRWMDPVPYPSDAKKDCQRWVFSFYHESAIYHGQKVGYSISAALGENIDWTMTYRADSDFFQPMYRLGPLESEVGEATLSVADSPATGKPNLLLWLASNCDGRKDYFEALGRHLPQGRAHIFGGCGEEMPCPRHGDKLLEDPDECAEKFFGQYKFYAALENSRCTGYVTEKFARAYRFGMVPVVVGGRSRADYEAIAPADSFIHIDDFSSTQALADHLLELDRDDAAYGALFAWRGRAQLWPRLKTDVQPYCELCQELHKPRGEQRPSRGNVLQWWYDDACNAEPYPSELLL